MTPLAASILGGILCGIAMVVGGIALLYKGAIRLEAASKDPALTVDLFNKQFSLATRFPALGLFVIGLLFIIVAMYAAKVPDVPSIPISGEVDDVDGPITVTVHTEWTLMAPQREVSDVLRPSLDVLWIRIAAPGFLAREMAFPRDTMNGRIKLGTVHLERVHEKMEPNETNIKAAPFTAPKFDPRSQEFQSQQP